MPILIILLFYINDLVKIKRYYAQTEFVAQQVANIIQNISQQREDKRITKSDLSRAFSLAWLSAYPGKTMYFNSALSGGSRRHELSHSPCTYIYYVKGLSGGKASCIWMRRFMGYTQSSPTGWDVYSTNNYVDIGSGTNVTPSSIHPELKIKEGEVKIIINANMYCESSSRLSNVTSAKQAFGCYFIAPKHSSASSSFFSNSVVIFTPKPGLFSETPPS